MGVVASKGYNNNTPLLNLCKERKELIRAARDARYHLARSHLLYFRSLLDFSNFLNQFVHEELIVIPFSSDDDSSSTDLICCGSYSDSDSDSDCLVCDRSQNDEQNPRKAAPGDGTCCSSNYVQACMEKSGETFLEFEKKVFVSAPNEDERRGSQNPSSFEQNIFMGYDILGLYDFVEQTQSFYIKPHQRDEFESDGLREIRKREGIPDLEPETESVHNSLIRKNCKKKMKMKTKNVKESSPVATEIDQRDIVANTCSGQVTVVPDKSNENCVQETQKPTEVVIEQVIRSDEEVCDEAYESSSSCSESSGLGLTDLSIVVEKINYICEKALCNSEISEFLEVSRVIHHQPLGSQFKGFASRILGSSENSKCNLQPKRGLVKENLAGSLSMILEKLYIWEKKLFAEVTVEEKHRISYDKGYKILRNLDHSGAEPSEIYEAETVVNHQLSKLNVSVRAVESISMRIHKIRDEELSFEVIEIINRFKHMWRFLAKCHHKQFLIVAKSNSCIQIVEKGSSSRKATQKVEERIRRYKESLRGYIDAQRNFVILLNEWLNRNIMEDDDSKIEAPQIFQVCSQWLRQIENVEENEVLSAMEEIELKFRELGLKQEEEVKQRMRTERLCKELEKETKELEEIWGTATAKMMVGSELLSLRERVTQEREKHERLMREVNDAVSISLQECLVHVFEALEEFCFANFKACCTYHNLS